MFASCNGEEVIEKWPEIGNYYDSSKPIELKSMSPDWGHDRKSQSFLCRQGSGYSKQQRK